MGDNLTELNTSLTHLNDAVDRLNGGLDHFEATLSRIDDLISRLVTLVAPVEAVVERIDYMVGVGETVMSPLSVTEHALRNVFNALRNRARVSARPCRACRFPIRLTPRAPACRGMSRSPTPSPRSRCPRPARRHVRCATAVGTAICSPSPRPASSRSTDCPRTRPARASPTT